MSLLPALRHTHDREILGLAVPAFGALVAEPLFLLGDSAIVGHLGTAPQAGLAVAGQALTTIVGVCIFLAYGTTASVARQIGAGHPERAVRQGVDGIWLALAIGAGLIAVGLPVVSHIVGAFGPSATAAPQAETYLRISLFGIPAMLVVLAGTGVLRGLQDTRTPLAVSIGSFALNLLLNAVFVLGLHWGIGGSATGTVLAQTAGAVVYLVVVVRGARRYGAPLLPDLAGVRAAATAGVALIVRTVVLQAALVAATAVAAHQGDVAAAAYAIGSRIWLFLAFALDAIAIAGQAITGRYLGAADVAGTRAATRRMIEWGLGCGIVFGLLVVAARPWLPLLFSHDPAVHELLERTLLVIAAVQPIGGVAFVLDGVLIGAGDNRYLAVATTVAMVVFLPAAWLVYALDGGLVALWLALGLWMTVRCLTLAVRARGTGWLVTGTGR